MFSTEARTAVMAFVVLLLAAVLVMAVRLDPVTVDGSAVNAPQRAQSPQNAPDSPTPLR